MCIPMKNVWLDTEFYFKKQQANYVVFGHEEKTDIFLLCFQLRKLNEI